MQKYAFEKMYPVDAESSFVEEQNVDYGFRGESYAHPSNALFVSVYIVTYL